MMYLIYKVKCIQCRHAAVCREGAVGHLQAHYQQQRRAARRAVAARAISTTPALIN